MKLEKIEGRRILKSRLSIKGKLFAEKNQQCQPAMTINGNKICCNRCRTEYFKADVQLPAGYYYCPACIRLGRVTSRDELVYGPAGKKVLRNVELMWEGTLTATQQEIAEKLKKAGTHLVWAVAGAGKTEMLFPVIQKVLAAGGRVGVASPRIDVCNELFPRLQAAFPKERSCLLHSDSQQLYQNEVLIVCTIHQLLHFYQAFDLLIIDEADAFPYEGDPLLEKAVQTAKGVSGILIYLTATPSSYLRSKLPANTTEYRLPARYHRRPLPIPQFEWWQRSEENVRKKYIPKRILTLIQRLSKDTQLLLFCPSIPLIRRLKQILKEYFSELTVEAVWAEAKERGEKVYRMRGGAYDLLLTTTILERGVTFENISVIIFQADHHVFTKSALVQIAGRVDRKGSCQKGEVVFLAGEWTEEIAAAIKEIKENNRLGKERGLLDDL